jgi:hypothetical protein
MEGLELPRLANGPGACRATRRFPCATENEVSAADAKTLLDNGCFCVSEAANMPTVPDGVNQFVQRKIPVCAGQSGERGRGRDQRTRDGAKRNAHLVDSRGGRCQAEGDHEVDSPDLRRRTASKRTS